MIIDKNNLEIPTFIDGEFFETALINGLQEINLRVIKVFFTMCSKPGENYCSMIFRANVTYTTESVTKKIIALIVKVLPVSVAAEEFKAMDMFLREAAIYQDALQKIENILHGERIAPKFIYYTDSTLDTIVFEDVTPQGFTLADRVNGLDEAHCEVVLRKLATFHAASMVLAAKHPVIFEKFRTDSVSVNREISKTFRPSISYNFNELKDMIATWPGFEAIVQKFGKISEIADECYGDWVGPMEGELKVLNHNDLWVNNILFSYEDGKPTDTLFIDFQLSFYSSPGIDITHFLYTSPQYHLLEEKRDYMIEELYYKTLKTRLENQNFTPIPTLEQIYEEIRRREITGLFWSVVKLGVICMDKDKCGNNSFDTISDANKGKEIRAIGMSSKRFVGTMKYILRKLDSIDLLE